MVLRLKLQSILLGAFLVSACQSNEPSLTKTGDSMGNGGSTLTLKECKDQYVNVQVNQEGTKQFGWLTVFESIDSNSELKPGQVKLSCSAGKSPIEWQCRSGHYRITIESGEAPNPPPFGLAKIRIALPNGPTWEYPSFVGCSAPN